MNKILFVALCTFLLIIIVDGKKSFKSRSSGSGRGTSRKTNYNPQPVPTSLSYPQPSAQKPSLFGWQEKSSKNAQTFTPKQTKPQQTHSYPSSQSGMSGNNQHKQQPNQDSIQRTSASQNQNGQQAVSNPASQPARSQTGHSYPASNGLSGGSGASYPQQSPSNGLSGTGAGYPQQSAPGGAGHSYPSQAGSGHPHQQVSGHSGVAPPPPYTGGGAPPPYPGNANRPTYGGTYPNNNNYQHPPPYSNAGYNNYGSYGGHGSYSPGFNPQTPGYFGNYGKGFGSVSRGSSALKGVGIAGAGVGTLLTGLALWNLARSTGHHHHTVIYDNRGQPVAVAPANNTAVEVDPILADLVNCTLSISNGNNTEVLAIPCSIATSFTPDAELKQLDNNGEPGNEAKCTVTVTNKAGREFMTTIPCSILLNTAAENNVTEPPIAGNNMTNVDNVNSTLSSMVAPSEAPLPSDQLAAQTPSGTESNLTNATTMECTPEPGEIRDPINPCFAVTHNVTVAPLQNSESTNAN